MRPGTPGFIGARLKEARESRGMAAITLADLLGVSRQAISQYENSTQSPRPEIMERIVKLLQLPHHFFRRPAMLNTEAVIFYRSMSAATKTERLRAGKRYSWLKDIVKYLQEFVQLPKVNFPDLSPPDDLSKISNQLIEEYAVKVRRLWGLGDSPISNLVLLLENNGAVVVRYELGAETLDAFSEF
ncbi:MAG: helix-turn-helix transcriptional regulator, partial [Deltaproteobacteria bacterium]|nr:helix-turn-helix transcriptional regulator [Deltaproteobacteria bacterium]